MDKVAAYKEYIYKQANIMDMSGQFTNMGTRSILGGFMMDKILNASDIRNHFDHNRSYDENGMDVFDRVIHTNDHKYDRF